MRTTVDVVDAALDEDRLSELAGREVRATRVRIKPEVSVAVALADRDSGAVAGWARFLWPVSHAKAGKAHDCAQQRGQRVRQRAVADGIVLQDGEVAADPAVGGHLHDTSQLVWPKHGELPLLRYNPLRRVVVRDGERVVRVAARPDQLGYAVHRLLAPKVSMPERIDDGTDPHVSVQRVTGNTDLARTQSLKATRAAGAELAALHAVDPGELGGTLAARTPLARRQAGVHADLIDHLAPVLAIRIRELATRLPDETASPGVVSHGDASPDQVLVRRGPRPRVWLTDFDRVCLAPRAVDLGSYLATVDPEVGSALLDGYREAGGTLPEAEDLLAAQARSVFLRLADPLRHADPHWRDKIADELDRLAELLP